MSDNGLANATTNPLHDGIDQIDLDWRTAKHRPFANLDARQPSAALT